MEDLVEILLFQLSFMRLRDYMVDVMTCCMVLFGTNGVQTLLMNWWTYICFVPVCVCMILLWFTIDICALGSLCRGVGLRVMLSIHYIYGTVPCIQDPFGVLLLRFE